MGNEGDVIDCKELSDRYLESFSAGKQQGPCLAACALRKAMECAQECAVTPAAATRAIRQASR